eukprot:7516941-Alexandrium_andersonii.AAC.1
MSQSTTGRPTGTPVASLLERKHHMARTEPLSRLTAFSTDPLDCSSYAGGLPSATRRLAEPIAVAGASATPRRRPTSAGSSSV